MEPHRFSKHGSQGQYDRAERSRSPYRDSHHHRHKRRRTEDKSTSAKLPAHARPLDKHDFDSYRPLFALYLDVQKQIDIQELSEKETKGRWKSFLGKWNRGELAEGWYDPATQRRADEAGATILQQDHEGARRRSPAHDRQRQIEDESDDDEFGPALPVGGVRPGPAIPNFDDLAFAAESRAADHAIALADLKHERKLDRTLQKSLLEELAPRADPGSRERQLERKRAVASIHASFKDAKESGDVEIRDSDLIGEDGGGVEGYKREKREMERKKNEREVRREEQLRARMAEREERLRAVREKEEKTMEFLRGLARERYGGVD